MNFYWSHAIAIQKLSNKCSYNLMIKVQKSKMIKLIDDRQTTDETAFQYSRL